MAFLVKDKISEPLHAIVPFYNPFRWKTREKHTIRALKHFHDAGATITLVEIGFNRRDLVFADSGLDGTASECGILGTDGKYRHKYIGLHTKDELWLKENAINIGVQNLPHDWQQVCWLDSDVIFARPNWVGECIHKLQHYAFLQMFSQARDLGPNYEMLPENYPHANGVSFVSAWQAGEIKTTLTDEIAADLRGLNPDLHNFTDFAAVGTQNHTTYPPRVFPGLAWACTRKAWDDVGGLLDVAIWGGGDFHASLALVEKVEGMMRNDLHRNYKKLVMQWYERCRTHIRRNVGVMEGAIFHNWHGRKTGRGYNAKHALLAKFGFDPLRHLKRDSQGLWQLHDDRSTSFVQIRDMLRRIAKERDEDSNDTRLDLTSQGH